MTLRDAFSGCRSCARARSAYNAIVTSLSVTPSLRALMQLKAGPLRRAVKAVTASAIRRPTTNRFAPSRKLVLKADRQDTYLKVAKFICEISVLQAVCRPCANGQAAREACP